MIETWLQLSCDGCDDPNMVDNTDMSDVRKSDWRSEKRIKGWRSYGTLDYCPTCVEKGNHKLRTSIFNE